MVARWVDVYDLKMKGREGGGERERERESERDRETTTLNEDHIENRLMFEESGESKTTEKCHQRNRSSDDK